MSAQDRRRPIRMKHLPNNFYESLDGIWSYDISAVCFGVERSATTMIHQVVSSVFDKGVVKTHSFFDTKAPVVITMRDFRDCTVSWAQVSRYNCWRQNSEKLERLGLEPDKPTERFEPLLIEEAVRAANRIKSDVANLNLYRKQSREIHKYENFVHCPSVLAGPISNTLGVEVPESAFDEFTLRNNWRIGLFSDEPLQEEPPELPIEGGHCGLGEIGKWKNEQDCVQEYLVEFWRKDLEAYGYAI